MPSHPPADQEELTPPVVYVLAGPNGTGKTTFYNIAIEQQMIDPALPFLNIDNICRDLPGSYSESNYIRAEELYRKQLSGYLGSRSSFMIESNLARETDYDWLFRFQKAGYRLYIYFLWTNDVAINVSRVISRVAEGGHDVPEPIIRHRYDSGLSLLRRFLHLIDEAALIDCSGHRQYLEVAAVGNKMIVHKVVNCPPWAARALWMTEKLAGRAKP